MRFQFRLCVAGLLLSIATPTLAHPGAHPQRPTQTEVPAAPALALDAVATANAFTLALTKGDATTVMSLLANDVVIYESGGQESSRKEYASHHLPLDIAFLANMKTQVLDQKQGGDSNVAWVITRSRFTGTHKGKAVDLYGTESLVLQHFTTGWKIVHVHWSSQPVESKAS